MLSVRKAGFHPGTKGWENAWVGRKKAERGQ